MQSVKAYPRSRTQLLAQGFCKAAAAPERVQPVETSPYCYRNQTFKRASSRVPKRIPSFQCDAQKAKAEQGFLELRQALGPFLLCSLGDPLFFPDLKQ